MSSSLSCPPHHPILPLKEKDKKQVKRNKTDLHRKDETGVLKKNRQDFKQNKYKAPLSYLEITGSNKTRAKRQGVKGGPGRGEGSLGGVSQEA